MSQHKATNEELVRNLKNFNFFFKFYFKDRRKVASKSKNLDLVKYENQKKEVLKSI